MKHYLSKLMSQGLKYSDCITEITLEKKRNQQGIEYAECRFQFVQMLQPEDKTQALKFNGFMRKLIESAQQQAPAPQAAAAAAGE